LKCWNVRMLKNDLEEKRRERRALIYNLYLLIRINNQP